MSEKAIPDAVFDAALVEVVKDEFFAELHDALEWALYWIDYCGERPLPEPETEETEDFAQWQAAAKLIDWHT